MAYPITSSEFFQIFVHCTIHLFWGSKNSDLQQSFSQYLWKLKNPTHTLIQSINENQTLSSLPQNNGENFINFTTQVDLNQTSNIYHLVFQRLKYSSFCKLQFPALDGFDKIYIDDYFDSINDFVYYTRREKDLYLPDYIIVKVHLRHEDKNALKFDTHFFLAPLVHQMAKVIILSQSDNKIFKACLPHIYDCWAQN